MYATGLNQKINDPLSEYATRLLRMYIKFPEDQPFTALDWNAQDGTFLSSLTKDGQKPFLYGISDSSYNCKIMREKEFHKVSEAHYRSEAKITNEVFSFMVVNPVVHENIIDMIFDSVDPYDMPNFETEIRESVMRQEEERRQLQEDLNDQIDFSVLNDDNTEKTEKEETAEQKEARLQKKIRIELEKRVKAWRMAMKEQQKRVSSLRFDNFLLQRATTYLRPGGILAMVTPKELIDDSIAFKLVNQFEDIKILRLDDDEYLEHRKCIILAKKRQKATREDHELGKAISRTKERPYKAFGEIREVTCTPLESQDRYDYEVNRAKVDAIYDVLSPQIEPSYVVPIGDPEEVASFRVGPITGNEALSTLKKSKLMATYQEKYSQVFTNKNPVTPTPLHKGHIMLLLTSGFLNGYIGTGPDQHLVKGSAIKDVREFSEEDDEGNTRVVEREYYNIGVKLLNAQGEFRKIM